MTASLESMVERLEAIHEARSLAQQSTSEFFATLRDALAAADAGDKGPMRQLSQGWDLSRRLSFQIVDADRTTSYNGSQRDPAELAEAKRYAAGVVAFVWGEGGLPQFETGSDMLADVRDRLLARYAETPENNPVKVTDQIEVKST
jgi:hypothetical protein